MIAENEAVEAAEERIVMPMLPKISLLLYQAMAALVQMFVEIVTASTGSDMQIAIPLPKQQRRNQVRVEDYLVMMSLY
jgi:hypothetical protein